MVKVFPLLKPRIITAVTAGLIAAKNTLERWRFQACLACYLAPLPSLTWWCLINLEPSSSWYKTLQSRDGPWPYLSILLTRSKWEAIPALAWVLFDPIWWYFFWPRRVKNWKIWNFKGKFSNAKPKPKLADPTWTTKICPYLGQTFLTQIHHYLKDS